MYPQSMFCTKMGKKVTFFHLKIIIFTALKNRSVLHGRVFVFVDQQQGNETDCSVCLSGGSGRVLLRALIKLLIYFLNRMEKMPSQCCELLTGRTF